MMNVRVPRSGDFVRGTIDGEDVTGVVKGQNRNGKLQIVDADENLYLVDDPTSITILRGLNHLPISDARRLNQLRSSYVVNN